MSVSMRHTISVKVENKFGVLARVAGMFSGRGFNIDTLNVGPTNDPTVSRMTPLWSRSSSNSTNSSMSFRSRISANTNTWTASLC
jgi:acetolactate synthase small subunit